MTKASSTRPEAPAPDAQSLSFEEALRDLEEVAGKLEAGGVGLEESLRLLARGTRLIERCERELTQAEAVLEQLTLSPEGELRSVRLSSEEDDDEDA
jgi:exodeoxyribonuclease VII small subunit